MVVEQMCSFAKVPGLNSDNWNVKFSQFMPEDRTDGLDSVFGGTIRGQTRVSIKTSHATNVYDATWEETFQFFEYVVKKLQIWNEKL